MQITFCQMARVLSIYIVSRHYSLQSNKSYKWSKAANEFLFLRREYSRNIWIFVKQEIYVYFSKRKQNGMIFQRPNMTIHTFDLADCGALNVSNEFRI